VGGIGKTSKIQAILVTTIQRYKSKTKEQQQIYAITNKIK